MPSRITAPAASSPATAAGTRPVASSTTIAARTPSAGIAPGPIGSAWRRTRSGELTTQDLGRGEVVVERLPGPCSSRMSPAASALARRRGPAPLALDGEDDEVAARRDHAGEQPLADQRRARRDHDLGEAGGAVEEAGLDLAPPSASSRGARRQIGGERGDRLGRRRARPGRRRPRSGRAARRRRPSPSCTVTSVDAGSRRRDRAPPAARRPGRARADPELEHAVVEAELLDQRARVLAEVGRQRPAAAVRQQRAARAARTMAMVPSEQRHADPGELEIAEAAAAGIDRGLETSTFTGVPVSASIEPAVGRRTPAASGAARAVGRSRTAMTTTTGRSAATAPLRLISAVSTATDSMVSTMSRVRLSPAPRDQDLPGPGGDAGRLEPGADDEQRGDEDRRGIAEAGQRLVERRARPSPRAPARSRRRRRRPAAGPRRTGRRRRR